MSGSRNVRTQSEESEEDIFQSTFANADNVNKVKITGICHADHQTKLGIGHHMDPTLVAHQINQARNEGAEKSDPSKEEGSPEATRDWPHPRPAPMSRSTRPAALLRAQSAHSAPSAQSGATGTWLHSQIGTDDTYSSPDEFDHEDEDVVMEITVHEPHKVGEGMSAFMAYRVVTHTNLPGFNGAEVSVVRRFSDFLGVHEKLREKYLPRGRIIPPAPEKSILGTTKVKIASHNGAAGGTGSLPTGTDSPGGNGSTQSSPNQKEFIARRRFALERFINRVAQHPVLRRDMIFIEFLQSNQDLPRATSTSALSSASVLRLIGRMGDTVNKMTYKMEENDPWYEDKVQQIDHLAAQLKKLYALAESLVQCRQDLASATGYFAHSTAMLANCEEAHSLSRALAQLAKVEESIELVHQDQAKADYFYLFELIKDYVGLVGAVKDALSERSKSFQNWQNAQSMLIKKKEQRSRLEMGGRTDKIPIANEEVIEWELRLEENQVNFNRISEVIKVEIALFERYRVKDFKVAIIQYLEALMKCQLQMVKHWEDFLPEVKNILY
ncbi:hypothetical protein TCAL_11623 [Tigriopus californicus]|uniref:PX domain-containing protein n=1 Tax=Tigriopus californicus TaxID=6832 RepID=A0A553NZU1_TIGCA|nr:sorting nexin-2-like [Tigriopus californicus]TRY70959.1 hypothetical protein TCAL_11623 [Tigriopus californicus]|eukprot:TCALIF_11623-PA protein Name:"Similar to Snx2 Sorting nexin-2 (Mus musculus)" AED:0.00 eAED:0.00 QI:133/1/0.5/1/1/0.5/2/0/554